MSMNSIIENNKQQIIELCKKHHVKNLFVFGSVMRTDFNTDSDIDFLYEFDTSKINFDDLDKAEYDYVNNFFSFQEDLENLLKRKIDLLPNKEIKNPFLNQSIEKDKELLYSNERFAEISY